VTTTITLKEPIEFGSETVRELTLRKPKAKDLRRFPMAPTMGDILDLVCVLTGRQKVIIDELGVEDLAAIAEVVGGFIPGGPGTGKIP
jgi:hypothetical protein